MGVGVSRTFEDAVDRLLSPTGAVLVVAFALYGWFRTVVQQSALSAGIEWAVNSFGATVAGMLGYDVSQSAVSVRRLHGELVERGMYFAAGLLEQLTSAGMDASLPVVLVFLVTLPFVAEFLHVVSVRALAADPDSMPSAALFDGLAGVYVRSLLSNFVAWVLIAIGLLLAVIPGLVLALVFLFVRQHVVLAGDDVFEALSESYATFRANLRPLVAVFTVLLLLGVGSTYGLGMVGVPGWLYILLSAVVVAFNLAVVTSAFLQTNAATAA